MYKLYYLADACSLATHVVLHQLNQAVEIIDKQQVQDFSTINPVCTVPVLIDGDSTLREGAAVMLHLLNKHHSHMLPSDGSAREQAIQDIMFANATMHPAYNRLFFITHNIADKKVRQAALESAAEAITTLWQVVEQQLTAQDFLGGEQASAADIMLTVYSRWGQSFPVDIPLGKHSTKMLDAVQAMPSFKHAVADEQAQSAA